MHVIDRHSGALLASLPHAPGMCSYHTGNTYEEADGSIVHDVVAYPDCSMMEVFYLDTLLHEPQVS